MAQLESTITNLTPATSANLTGAAVVPLDDSTATTVKGTLAQLRTKMFAGSTGYTAADPLVVGAINASGDTGIGAAALATSATTPFIWFPSTAGTPTGVPSASMGGGVAAVIDTAGSKLWARIAGTWNYASLGTSSPFSQKYAILTGSTSDALTATSWNKRTIDTEVYDPSGIVSITSSQFTLGAGTYLIDAVATVHGTNANPTGIATKLRNTTDSTDTAGLNVAVNQTAGPQQQGNVGRVTGVLTLGGAKVFELQQYPSQAAGGGGIQASGSGLDRYVIVTITQIA
jgi:hypothetical protein